MLTACGITNMNRLEPIVPAPGPQIGGNSARGGRIGVLIANLGTPDATDAASVRRYLKEFLSDARVIENQGLIWKLVLNGIILPRRPKVKGRDYEKIWNRERNESPLKTITRSQAAKLRPVLDGVDPTIMVDWGMRYGNPSLDSRIEALAKAGCERILLLPLYPQYAAATSATVCDAAFATLARLRDQPALRVVPPYYDLVSRHSEILRRGRRSLSGPLRGDGAASARAHEPRREEIDVDVPVAFRPRRMAAALHRQNR
jgi:ferrochelatase